MRNLLRLAQSCLSSNNLENLVTRKMMDNCPLQVYFDRGLNIFSSFRFSFYLKIDFFLVRRRHN
mgnify:CR=1 FL=1